MAAQNRQHEHWCRECGMLVVADRCADPKKPSVCYDCVMMGLV